MTAINTTIIDNRDGNTLLTALQRMGAGGRDLTVASAFFSLDALLLLADALDGYDRIRILFGDDASPKQRRQQTNPASEWVIVENANPALITEAEVHNTCSAVGYLPVADMAAIW